MFQAAPLLHGNYNEAERFSPKGGPNKLLLAEEVLHQRAPARIRRHKVYARRYSSVEASGL